MPATTDAQVEIFYDSLCPVCRREVGFLQRRDKNGNLRLIDIAAPDFAPARYGLELSDFIARMYVRDEQGILRHGLDSFPVMWGAVGLGWLWGWTRVGCGNWARPVTGCSLKFVPAFPSSSPVCPMTTAGCPGNRVKPPFPG